MSATYSPERLFSSKASRDLEDFVRARRPADESLEDFERQLRERTNAFSAAVMESVWRKWTSTNHRS